MGLSRTEKNKPYPDYLLPFFSLMCINWNKQHVLHNVQHMWLIPINAHNQSN